jgi:hypothetical protein
VVPYWADGFAPYSFSAAGALPAGVTLDADTGQLTGTVTTVGVTLATISCTDTTGLTVPQNEFSFTVSSYSISASILGALIAWWSFDENDSGDTYADSHGGNDLTLTDGGSFLSTTTIATNTPGQFVKNRASRMLAFDNRCAYIPRSNTALDLPNDNFSFGGWFNPNSIPATTTLIMGRHGGVDFTKVQAVIYIDSDETLRVSATTDGTLSTRVRTSGIASAVWAVPSTLTFVVLSFNRDDNLLEIRCARPGYASGAMQKQTVAFAGALYTGDTTSNFAIGDPFSNDTTSTAINRNGVSLVDECFYCLKAITDEEFEYLYNAGSGLSYSDLT